MWVPQRQRLGARWARTSSSVGRGVALEQRLGAHDHAGDAVAALRRLLGLEGDRQQAGLAVGRRQAFERAHLAIAQRGDRHEAGEDRLAVEQDGAGAALAQPAAELGAVECQLVAQHVEQRRVGIDIDLVGLAVDGEGDHFASPSRACATAAPMSDHGDLSVKRVRR